MDSELDRIDIIRSRLHVSYADAKKALDEASGDVVTALASLESNQAERRDILALGVEVADEVQKLVAGGPMKRVRVKYGDKLITEAPVALTAAAAVAVGLAAVLLTKLVIEVEREQPVPMVREEGTAR